MSRQAVKAVLLAVAGALAFVGALAAFAVHRGAARSGGVAVRPDYARVSAAAPRRALSACVSDPVIDAARRLGEATRADETVNVDAVLVFSAHDSCGTGGCQMVLYAPVDGCFRFVGEAFGGGIRLLSRAHGLPRLLVERRGRNSTDFRMAFDGVEYVVTESRECADDDCCGPWRLR